MSDHARDLAEEVLTRDLEHIIASAEDELARIAGRNLLVTGGAGFLGYELVQSALARNRSVSSAEAIRVTILDNFSRGVPAWLDELAGATALKVVRHDVSQPLPADLPAFDYVVHAAGIASPTYYRLHPIETMDANINGLRLLLDRCLEQRDAGHAISGILFFSSSEIYGDPPADWIPTPETYRGNVSCTGPRACYDESKRFGETLAVTFARQYGLPISIARPFNNYGPGLKIADGRVIPDFARDILAGRDIVMLSDGAPTRTYCYVADAVSGYFKVLVRGSAGEPYNIGTDAPEISVAELAVRMAAIASDTLGYGGRVLRGVSDEANYLVDNPDRRRPDLTKARTELGYRPSIELDEGLRRSLTWYIGNPETPAA